MLSRYIYVASLLLILPPSSSGYACSLQLLETIDELQRNPIIREMYAVTRYNILAHLIQKDY